MDILVLNMYLVIILSILSFVYNKNIELKNLNNRVILFNNALKVLLINEYNVI
jgi:hypothetical protein